MNLKIRKAFGSFGFGGGEASSAPTDEAELRDLVEAAEVPDQTHTSADAIERPLWLPGVLAPEPQKPARLALQFAAIYTVLIAWHWSGLTTPPTYDQAKGIWLEGIFLAETDFDYSRLRNYEQSTGEGGAFVYSTSALPTLIAAILKLTPTPRDALLVYHLFHLACGAVVLQWVYRALSPLLGGVGGALACAATATSPPFSLQLAMAGMEMPTAALGFSALVVGARGQYVRAAALGFAAALLKLTGLVYILALAPVGAVAAIHAGFERDLPRARRHALGVALLLLAVYVMIQIFAWGRMDHLARRPIHLPID